ncbi:heparan-alpha-glucosaminide N-acetyltransferase domain-containing protein [Aquipuribacter nitratireducens]|uniref:Heparan-alpha-glucosaminide N-acetyltransferase domain-containing protein n=1 Tax=Aquipuribacter nitratireducens TaxID=650104 RepID=A0ABW0GVV1_9MICO
MTRTDTAQRPGPLLGSRRLRGVDAARGLALLGMMATHLLDRSLSDGTANPAFALADGRASATFALLAGAGLALADGATDGPRTSLGHAWARTAVRAVLVLVVGLTLASLGPPVAVILQYYAVLFVLVVPFVRLPAAVLALGGGLWLLLAPVASQWLRLTFGLDGPGPQVGLERLLVQPVASLQDLLLTGYYPVLTWFGYLLLGAAVGRLPLRRTATALGLVGSGLLLAAGSWLVSWALLSTAAAQRALAGGDPLSGRGVEGPFFGTTPTSSWWWLAIRTPHSGAPLDLLGTAGVALAVVGACLLVARGPAGAVLLPLAAAGSMTLTLYSAHVVAVWAGQPGLTDPGDWIVHSLVALVVAWVWRMRFRRGPLEEGVAQVVDAVAGPVPPREQALAPGTR